MDSSHARLAPVIRAVRHAPAPASSPQAATTVSPASPPPPAGRRTRAWAGPRGAPSQSAQQPATSAPDQDSNPGPGPDLQWRTTCRTCGSSFESRNRLMRHLFSAHPGKKTRKQKNNKKQEEEKGDGAGGWDGSKPRTGLGSPGPGNGGGPEAQDASTAKPRPKTEIHPLSLLSEGQMMAFVMRVLAILFVVGIRQKGGKEEEEEVPGLKSPKQRSGHRGETGFLSGQPAEGTGGVTGGLGSSCGPNHGPGCGCNGSTMTTRPEMREAKIQSPSDDIDDDEGGALIDEPGRELWRPPPTMSWGTAVGGLNELVEDLD
ncbi:hypothetical protein VTJ83DRAFT_7091 [Remersonia thermophila]|uniref:C2H2-type domain-containing protein n=1 Tax=Remersonia thermophila TaxID=72144 RepID=A0ABR4D2I0_9PEZI